MLSFCARVNFTLSCTGFNCFWTKSGVWLLIKEYEAINWFKLLKKQSPPTQMTVYLKKMGKTTWACFLYHSIFYSSISLFSPPQYLLFVCPLSSCILWYSWALLYYKSSRCPHALIATHIQRQSPWSCLQNLHCFNVYLSDLAATLKHRPRVWAVG